MANGVGTSLEKGIYQSMGTYSLRKYIIQWKFSVLHCVCFQSQILIVQSWMRLFMIALKKILFFPFSWESGRMAQWNRNVFNKKRHHKNACWQQNRQGTVKLLCFYIRPDWNFCVFILDQIIITQFLLLKTGVFSLNLNLEIKWISY